MREEKQLVVENRGKVYQSGGMTLIWLLLVLKKIIFYCAAVRPVRPRSWYIFADHDAIRGPTIPYNC